MLFQLRVAPSGEVVEGTDGQFLQYDLTERKWRTVDLSAILAGQIRFLVGPAGSGANYTDLATAIADAEQAFVDTGARQTVFLIGGVTHTAVSPLAIPESVDLDTLGEQKATIGAAVQLEVVTAAIEQTIANVIASGVAAVGAVSASWGILAVAAGATLNLWGCGNVAPGATADAGVALAADARAGTVDLSDSDFQGGTSVDGTGFFQPVNPTATGVVRGRHVRLSGESAVRIAPGVAPHVTSLDFDSCSFAASGARGIFMLDNPIETGSFRSLNGTYEATDANAGLLSTASFGSMQTLLIDGGDAVVSQVIKGAVVPGAPGDELTIRGLQQRPAAGTPGTLFSPSLAGRNETFIDGCSLEGDTLLGNSGGPQFSGCEIVLDNPIVVSANQDPLLVGCDVTIGNTAGVPAITLAGSSILDIYNNAFHVDATCTLLADGPVGAVIRTGGNVADGNPAWTTPANTYGANPTRTDIPVV